MTIEELMVNTDTCLEWHEPRPGMDVDGKSAETSVTLRATVKDCINYQRERSKSHNYPLLSEKDLLLDFIAINWAYIPGVMVELK